MEKSLKKERAKKTMSLEHEKEEDYFTLFNAFIDELGIEPDMKKIRYYILLDELF